MTQTQLHRAVASATGESCRTIRALGFSLVEAETEASDEAAGLALDCPACGHEVPLTGGGYDALPPLAACPGCDTEYPYALHEVYPRGLEPVAC